MIKHCQDLSFVRVSRRLGHKAKHTLNTYNGKELHKELRPYIAYILVTRSY